jgi:hypothetical protein
MRICKVGPNARAFRTFPGPRSSTFRPRPVHHANPCINTFFFQQQSRLNRILFPFDTSHCSRNSSDLDTVLLCRRKWQPFYSQYQSRYCHLPRITPHRITGTSVSSNHYLNFPERYY